MKKKIFEVKNLNIYDKYNKDKKIFTNINFDLFEDEILCIVGKDIYGYNSVILKSLVRMHDLFDGSVKFFNKDIKKFTDIDVLKYRTDIGYVLNSGGLISNLSIRKNISLPLTYHTDLDIDEIEKSIHEYCIKYKIDDILDKRPEEITFEQQKMVNIIRAQIINPKVIFYSNPLKGVRIYKYSTIYESINSYKRKHRISGIVVTDNVFFAMKVANRILIISDSGTQTFIGEKGSHTKKVLYNECTDLLKAHTFTHSSFGF